LEAVVTSTFPSCSRLNCLRLPPSFWSFREARAQLPLSMNGSKAIQIPIVEAALCRVDIANREGDALGVLPARGVGGETGFKKSMRAFIGSGWLTATEGVKANGWNFTPHIVYHVDLSIA
jgi:hypothetical protein